MSNLIEKIRFTFPSDRKRTTARLDKPFVRLTIDQNEITKKEKLNILYEEYNNKSDRLNKILNDKERDVKDAQEMIDEIFNTQDEIINAVLSNAKLLTDPKNAKAKGDLDKNMASLLGRAQKIIKHTTAIGPVERRRRSRETLGFTDWMLNKTATPLIASSAIVSMIYAANNMSGMKDDERKKFIDERMDMLKGVTKDLIKNIPWIDHII